MPLLINGQIVSDHVLDLEVLRLSNGLEMDAPNAGGHDPSHVREIALRNVIDRTILLQTASERKLRVMPDEVEAELVRRWGVNRSSVCDPGSMDTLHDDLLLQRVSDDLTRHVPRPGRAEAERYYRTHQHGYRVAEAVQAAHILCGYASQEEEPQARHRIEQANEALMLGQPFPKVANSYSDCKGVGGSIGWVARGVMVPEFEEVVFALEPGQRSGVFRTIFGFHVATVTGRRKAGVVPFAEVRLEIAKRMLAEARQHALQTMLARTRAASDIRYTDDKPHA